MPPFSQPALSSKDKGKEQKVHPVHVCDIVHDMLRVMCSVVPSASQDAASLYAPEEELVTWLTVGWRNSGPYSRFLRCRTL